MASILGRRFGPYLEIFKTLWANRRSPLYAMRILRHGVCDGCALGTSGLKDWTMSGVHLCWIRLNLLHLNTMKSFEPSPLSNLDSLKGKTEKELRMLGRVQSPLVRRRGEPGFTPVSWEEAEDLIADKISKTEPKRSAFYLVSRGTTNETYYATQKVARFLGTNHVDNSARICHSPSTTGLKTTIGFAATTCSYKDLIGSDLVVFIGSDAANNQPVLMKYMHLAKEAGTKVLSINPYREPGLEKYWVPSSVRSAVLGTEIVEQHFPVKVGGDIAFLNGTMKVLHERGALNDRFIAERTSGWDEVQEELKQSSFEELETASGVPQATMESFADYLEQANSAVFVWSMGITMHRHGVANVQTIANLALALGFVGKPKCGLMPIRGHSGVQGGAEMGCVPNTFPGGAAVGSESAKDLSRHWNFEVPDWPGSYVVDMINQAEKGDLDFLYCVGSNLLDVLPDRAFVRRALENISLRVHHDIVLNRQMFVEPKDTVLILPATTRYEMEGGNTETSTERRVIYNPEILGPRVKDARDEWRVLCSIAAKVKPELADRIQFDSTHEIRAEIAKVIPQYRGIENLRQKGDQFQWGGAMLGTQGFGFPDGKARFQRTSPPKPAPESHGKLTLSTRRGKQFNSMLFGKQDMLVGASRKEAVLAPSDMKRLNIKEGDPIRIWSSSGQMEGMALPGDIAPGTIMMYWPEANVLIPRGNVEPQSGMPAFRETYVEVASSRAS